MNTPRPDETVIIPPAPSIYSTRGLYQFDGFSAEGHALYRNPYRVDTIGSKVEPARTLETPEPGTALLVGITVVAALLVVLMSRRSGRRWTK